jgi:hypothetical protein
MLRPRGGDVIEGTGGLRKLRFAPRESDRGKSGGLRICYAYFEQVATVVLGLVYGKGEKDDLTPEDKAHLRLAVRRVEEALLSRPYRSSRPEMEES